jgi:hypothetical protein
MIRPAVQPDEAYEILAQEAPPSDLRVDGVLDYSLKSQRTPPREFPSGLSVDLLDLSGQEITVLPSELRAYEVNLSDTPIVSLPDDIRVESRLDLTRCDRLEWLPCGLTVGTLSLRGCTALPRLPEGLDVWFLDLSGCWALEHWPRAAKIRSGQLQLRGCTAMRALPPYLDRLSALNVRDCPNLGSLPDCLVVTGWIDLGHSGLQSESALPEGLAQTQLRWAGVNVDRRIAFHPETIQVGEVLAESNAERRRVMLDRYGFGRFLQDARAQTLDRDTDPGGPRQLLRVALEGDEDLVAMSCFCPSTGRQYMIRVPPTTSTCRQAAAWIAGFDNADDYQPIQET